MARGPRGIGLGLITTNWLVELWFIKYKNNDKWCLNSYLSVEDRILRRVEFRQKAEPKDRDFSRIIEAFQLIGDHFTTKYDITSMYKMFNFLDEETNKSKSLFIIFTTKLIENLPEYSRTS